MKILSNKKWIKMNCDYVDIQLDNAQLKDDNKNYKDQVSKMVDINKELSKNAVILGEKIKDYKKEIRRLKTLCTKNKIDYKNKKEKKVCKKK